MRTFVLAAAIVLTACVTQALPALEVESIYDSQGLFTYKVKAGTDITWNFPTSGSFLTMTLPGATELITPDGWIGQFLGDDRVLWKAGANAQTVGGEAITFGVRSTFTDVARFGRYNGDELLDPTRPAGAVAAYAITPGGGDPALGFLGFEYIGPMAAPVPEPAGIGAALLGALYLIRRRQTA